MCGDPENAQPSTLLGLHANWTVLSDRRFGTTYRSHRQRSSSTGRL